MRGRALWLVGVMAGGLLTACAPGPGPGAPLRDASAAISSQVDVTAARLQGDWVIRRAWPGRPAPAVGGVLGFEPGAAGLRVSGAALDGASVLQARGNGRFAEARARVFGGKALWVLWMDADSRTAAIGTPGGEFGWIMDRRSSGGDDRLAAAGEVMAWMGYDMDAMRKGRK